MDSSWNEADIVTGDRIKNAITKHGALAAYIKTDIVKMGRSMMWRGAPHTITPAKIWVSGHSDYAVTPDVYSRYVKHCKFWLAVNKEVEGPHITSFPLGIPNDCSDSPLHPIYGNTRIMFEVAQEPRGYTNLAYMNITVGTYSRERAPVFNMFNGKSWVTTETPTVSMEGRAAYLRQLRNHKFAVCPRGNGVDTHRFWEALYMGAIPITRREMAMRDFEDLPVCWIDNWSQVTEEFLTAEYERITSIRTWNMEKLKLSYWETLITNKIIELGDS